MLTLNTSTEPAMKLKPVLRKDLQDPLHPKHREMYTQTGYYERMKRYSDQQTEQFITVLESAGLTVHRASLDDDYKRDIDMYVNGVPISLKTPLTTRSVQPIELLREDRTNKWRASWGMTTKADYLVWYQPDRSILCVSTSELKQYILANVHPLTNNSETTRKKLEEQGRPANVVNRWVTHDELYSLSSSFYISNFAELYTIRGYFSKLGKRV